MNSFIFEKKALKLLNLKLGEYFFLRYFMSNENERAVSFPEIKENTGLGLTFIKENIKSLLIIGLIKKTKDKNLNNTNVYFVDYELMKKLLQVSESDVRPTDSIITPLSESDVRPTSSSDVRPTGRSDVRPTFIIKEKEKEIIKETCNPVFKYLIEYWNSKKIIVHEPTDKLIKSISKLIAKKRMPLEALKMAIDRFSEVYTSNDYYWTHKWSLEEFLGRKNAHVFFTDEFVFEKYLKKQPNSNNKEQQKQNELDKIYRELMGDDQFKDDNCIEVDFMRG